MKKLIGFAGMLFLGMLSFAKTDLQLRLCPVFSQVSYQINDEALGNAETVAELGVINYNFIDEGEHFGVFEMLGLNFSGNGCFNFSVGAAFGDDLNEAMRFQGGFGANFFYYSESNSEYSSGDGYNESDNTKIQFGVTADGQMKFTPNRLFSPVIGITFYFDPLCIGQTIKDGKSVHDNYDYYNRFAFSPYVSFCINLR